MLSVWIYVVLFGFFAFNDYRRGNIKWALLEAGLVIWCFIIFLSNLSFA